MIYSTEDIKKYLRETVVRCDFWSNFESPARPGPMSAYKCRKLLALRVIEDIDNEHDIIKPDDIFSIRMAEDLKFFTDEMKREKVKHSENHTEVDKNTTYIKPMEVTE